ncbi:ASPIC/UnbV domain-containing protein [Mariniblastus sp.]|nr:ASPIC/UnbV domain-containing protein [Mariniblastus sp.]
MRFAPDVDDEFSNLEQWGPEEGMEMMTFPLADDPKPGAVFRSNALSGGERNRLFMREDGNYKDLSLVSGIDFREDGRGFALLDYDRDGWLDLGITSPNYPRFRIAKNKMGVQASRENSFVEVTLVGGQESSSPSLEWSSREPFGARLLVTCGDEKRMFQLNCGEGVSTQNSKRIHIGMGTRKKIDQVEVIWPSGKRTQQNDILSGSRVELTESGAAQIK